MLVFLVVFIFLQDFRSTLIPMIAIPVALIGTFFLLYIFGFSINLLTLSALVLAIAIVVDDAIVVVEAVHAKLDQGYNSARRASIDAMNEIGSAIVSITLVMMLVFIPVSFMGGPSGVFYRQFGLTMAMAIFLSAINALTLSPALCALFLKPHNVSNDKADPTGGYEVPKDKEKLPFRKRFFYWFNVAFDAMLGKYKNYVKFFLNHKWLGFGSVAASVGILVRLMSTTPTYVLFQMKTQVRSWALSTCLPPHLLRRPNPSWNKVDSIARTIPAIETTTAITKLQLRGWSRQHLWLIHR